jgi:hypothetical protein
MKQHHWKYRFFPYLKALLLPDLRRSTLRGDSVRLLVLMAIDLAVVGSFPPYRLVDLTTPYMAFLFISRPAPRSLLLLLIAGITLEHHGSMPAGSYVCAYLMAMTVITLMRHQVAWRSYFPWMVTLVGVQGWVVLFELFMYLIKDPSFFAHNLPFLFSQGLKMLWALAMGTFFYLNSSKALGEERGFGISS